MRISDNIYNSYEKNKDINFLGNRIAGKVFENAGGFKLKKFYTKPIIENRQDVIFENLKNKLLNINNKIIEKINVKRTFETVIDYAKTLGQFKLIDFVLNEKDFHTEERANVLKEIIIASKSKNCCDFISKIFINDKLYKNDSLLFTLEPILYSFYTKDAVESRGLVLDKTLSEEKLYDNQDFVKNLGSIIYQASYSDSSYKTSKILEGVLADEELSNDKDFIKAVGKVLSIRDIARYANPDFLAVLESITDAKQYITLRTIAAILGKEGSDIFVEIMKNKELANDKDFFKYVPKIIYTISRKNVSKVYEIINYIQKNKFKKTEEFNSEVISEYMYGKGYSLSDIEKFVKIRQKAYEKKSQLDSFLSAEKVENNDIDVFFQENKDNIISAIELLGEKNFVHAFSLKLNGLKDLCEICSFIKEITEEDYYQELLLKINPSASKRYLDLQKKITELKGNYQEVVKSGDKLALKNLQNEINTLTKASQEVLASKLNYDPHTVINRIETIGRALNEDLRNENNMFISLLNDSNLENNLEWKKHCYKNLLKKLKIKYDENLIQKLNLIDSKYFGTLMVANEGFYRGLKKILLLIKNNPDKSVKEIFNELPNNQITKKEFQKFGINYNKWVDFDEKSYIKIESGLEGDCTNLTVKKVDLNDIAKSMFLGNEASCCTSVGRGIKQETVPNYIMNKLMGAIEVLDSNVPIANTMCYFATVNDEISLILDNIEVLPDYRDNEILRDAIFKYARKLCSEVGKPEMPVYVSGHRNKVDLKAFETDYMPIVVIGNSGENDVYLDFSTSCMRVDSDVYKYKFYDAELTKIPC